MKRKLCTKTADEILLWKELCQAHPINSTKNWARCIRRQLGVRNDVCIMCLRLSMAFETHSHSCKKFLHATGYLCPVAAGPPFLAVTSGEIDKRGPPELAAWEADMPPGAARFCFPFSASSQRVRMHVHSPSKEKGQKCLRLTTLQMRALCYQ